MYKVLLQLVFCLLVLFKSSQGIKPHHQKTHSLDPVLSPIQQQNKYQNYRNQQQSGNILNEIKTSGHLLHQNLNKNTRSFGSAKKTDFDNQVFLQLKDGDDGTTTTTNEDQAAAQLEEIRKANEEILKKLEEERRLYEERKAEEEKRKKEEALREALKKMAQDDFEKIQNLMDNVKSKLNSFQKEVDDMGNRIGTEIQEEIKTSIQKIQNQLVTHYKLVLEHAAKGDLEHRKITDQMTTEINEEVKQLFQKTHMSFCNIKELTIMLWEYQIKDNTKALNQLQIQADGLQRKLPPPESICNEYLECGVCNANPKCGWCLTQNKCVEGDNIGPLNEPCPLYDYDICRGFNCAFYKDCKSCLDDERCGWCDDLGSGAPLCLERPANYQGCTSDDWYHSQSLNQQCPIVTVAPFLDLKAAEEKEKIEKLIANRKRELEVKESRLTSGQKNIRESHNQLLKLKQSILSFKKDNEQLNQQIKITQDEIVNCQNT